MDSTKVSAHFPVKGLVKDLTNEMLGPDCASVFWNARIVNVEGTTYSVRMLKGTVEKFSLPNGFYLIGMGEYDGILYLCSMNNNGVVELGSYPSPRIEFMSTVPSPDDDDIELERYTILSTGREDVYRPILGIARDIYGAIPYYYGFRTKAFKYNDIDEFGVEWTPVKMNFKKAFDKTVNIYMCNGKSINRVVNSFFDEQFEIQTDRHVLVPVDYSVEETINSNTKQFLAQTKPPQGRLLSISTGGKLPAGNLFLYARYVDYEFNKTNFLPLEGPIAISHGNTPRTIYGGNPEKIIDYSDKQIKFKVRYLDKSYKFMEIAIAWHTGNSHTGLADKAILLDKRISMEDSNDEIDIIITGKERFATIDYNEIIRPVNRENICEYQYPINNRLWGVNWKEKGYNKEAMRELAKRVYGIPGLVNRNSCKNEDGTIMQDFVSFDYSIDPGLGVDGKAWYQDAFQVLDRTGYMRGEIYPFALVGLRTDGSFTEAFPITGYDNYEYGNGSNNISNEWSSDEEAEEYLSDDEHTNAGLYRMPQYGTGSQDSAGAKIDNINNILMFDIRLNYAVEYLNENTEDFADINGFYVVRADRIDNLICMGHTYNTFNYFKKEFYWDTMDHHIFSLLGLYQARNIFDNGVIGRSLSFPFINLGLTPRKGRFYYSGNGFDDSSTNLRKNLSHFDSADFLGPRAQLRKALFSPDVMFSNDSILDIKDYYLYRPYTLISPNTLQDTKIDYNDDETIVLSQPEGTIYYPIGLLFQEWGERKHGQVSCIGRLLKDEDILFKYNDPSTYPDTSDKYHFINFKFLSYSDNLIGNYNPYIKVICDHVGFDIHRSNNNFCSIIDNVLSDSVTNPGFFFNNSVISISTRATKCPSYIGIRISEEDNKIWPNNYIFWRSESLPNMLYREANTYYGVDKTYYEKVVKMYSLGDGKFNTSSFNYALNNLYYDKEYLRDFYVNGYVNPFRMDNFIRINGDCFVNRFFYKYNYNHKSYAKGGYSSPTSHTDYSHGVYSSVPIPSFINTSMRGIGEIGIYPNNCGQGIKLMDFAKSNPKGEDFIYDYGYSVTMHKMFIPGIDDTYPEKDMQYPTRVRYTDPNTAGAYIDGWRVMYYNSKQDFPAELGDIMGIAGLQSSVIAVHEHAICELAIDLKALHQDVSGETILLGAGSIIGSQSRKLSSFGSQHSVLQMGFAGIYGYDYKRSIYWCVTIDSNGLKSSLSAKSISSGVISSELLKRKDLFESSNINMIQNPLGILRSGITMGLDSQNKEVYVSLVGRKEIEFNIYGREITGISVNTNDINWPGYVTVVGVGGYKHYVIEDISDGVITLEADPIVLQGGTITLLVDLGFTYYYSEMGGYLAQVSFLPTVYSIYNEHIVSTDRLMDGNSSKVWFHNNSSERAQYYGYNGWFKLGFILNASKESLHTIQKMDSSLVVSSDPEPFDKFECWTEFQYGEMSPFVSPVRFWNNPEYSENKWSFNVPVQSSVLKQGYSPGAQIRGTWIEMLLTYRGTVPKYINMIFTKYTLSFS